MMIRILLLPVGGRPEVRNINPDLESQQAIVGGLIEHVRLDGNLILVVNEEGKCIGLKPNRALRDKAGRRFDVVVGDAFITRIAGPVVEDYVDLTDADVAHWSRVFERPLPEDHPAVEPDAGFVAGWQD